MIRVRFCAILGLAMLSVTSVQARQLEFSVENRVGGNSNVFRRSTGVVKDGFFEFQPTIGVREAHDDLRYNFRYSPIYQAFFQTRGVNHWDHTASGQFDWNLTPRDTLGFGSNFSQTRTLRLFTSAASAITGPVIDASDRQRIRRASASVYYSHRFSPRLSGRVNLNFSDIDFNSTSNVDTRAYGGSLRGTYAWSSVIDVGLSGSGRYRQNLGLGQQTSSTSTVGNVAFFVSGKLFESVEFSVQVGPSIIRTQSDSPSGIEALKFGITSLGGGISLARSIATTGAECFLAGPSALALCPFMSFLTDPATTPMMSREIVQLAAPASLKSASRAKVSYFADVSLIKRWKQANLSLHYLRSESASAGLGTSSIVDDASAKVTYRPSLGLSLSLRGQWLQRKAVSKVAQTVVVAVPGAPLFPGSTFSFAQADRLESVVASGFQNSSIQQWRLNASIKQRLTKRITVLARVRYLNSVSNFGSRDTKTNYVSGFLGLRYVFDPLIF